MTTTASEAVEDAARDRVIVTVDALRAELAAGATPAILDARWGPDGVSDFEAGHLPDAVCAELGPTLAGPLRSQLGQPLPAIDELRARARRWGLRPGQPVVVYDDLGGTAAARLWWLLRFGGVRSVRILDGGFGAWRAAGGPIGFGTVDVAPADVELPCGRLPIIHVDEASWWPERGALLDARPPDRFRGEVEPIGPRAGHIPGAINAPAADCLLPDGRFRPADELASYFESLRVARASYSAVYSGCGFSACLLIAALSSISRPAALYPGCWLQWSSDPDRPVATGA